MIINDGPDKKLFLECECNYFSHLVEFMYCKDINDNYPELFIMYHLNPRGSIIKRIWTAVKYILGMDMKNGDSAAYGETYISVKDAKDIKELIDIYIKEAE